MAHAPPRTVFQNPAAIERELALLSSSSDLPMAISSADDGMGVSLGCSPRRGHQRLQELVACGRRQHIDALAIS
jgi:hypothetical protein